MLSSAHLRRFSVSNKAYPKTFDKILIANRGEISRRVIRTCKNMGIRTVAVYSDADMHSMFVKEADEAYRIGPPPTNQSYLKMDTILEVVKASGAQAVHPGYGFLSENPQFQKLLQANNVNFIGPNTKAIVAMGDKIESKKLAKGAGVSTVPGYLGEVDTPEEVIKISRQIGYPVMIKASAGGGGKGMRIAYNDKEATEGFQLSKEEAISSFGDGRIFIEKYIEAPRHIEFQILGDLHGNYVWLPERECSVQRRNQKVIEEAPSTAMDAATRKKMGDQAVALARSCDYHTTGTVEFLMDKNKDFYFLEMNTRLQVEHPITEEITGIDLVEQQILISAGHKLQYTQDQVKINGHSLEYRVYAEDPSRKFLPSIGFLRKYKEPAQHPNIRIDTGVQEGSEISMYYDPMISKLITWGKNRKEAMDLLDKAFDEYVVQGVAHNIGFGKSILANESFAKGDYSTAFIPTFYPNGYHGDALTKNHMQKLALACHKVKNGAYSLYSNERDAVKARVVYVTVVGKGGAPDVDLRVELNGDKFTVTDIQTGESSTHSVDSYSFEHNSVIKLVSNGDESTIQFAGQKYDLNFKFVFHGGAVETLIYDETQYKYKGFMAEPQKVDHSRSVLSPMPGAMVSVDVVAGQTVVDGQQLCIIEAMKMQNIIKAERDGKIKSVSVKAGDSVAVDQLLIEFE